jgi:hypothetical protein
MRENRNALAHQAARVRHPRLDLIVAGHISRGGVTAQARRRAVQALLKSADPEEDAELLVDRI